MKLNTGHCDVETAGETHGSVTTKAMPYTFAFFAHHSK